MAPIIVHVATARLFTKGGQRASDARIAFQCSVVKRCRPKPGCGENTSDGGLTEILTIRYSGNSVNRTTRRLPPYHHGTRLASFMTPPCLDEPPAGDSSRYTRQLSRGAGSPP